MANFVRVRSSVRRPVRLGKTLVPNSGSGVLVDIDDPAVKRNLRALQHLVTIVSDSRSGLENFSVQDAVSNIAVPTLGVELYTAVDLPKGEVITSVTFVSGTTAGAAMTNQVAALYNNDGTTLTRVAVSADGTSTAWGANTAKTFTLTTPYTTVIASSGNNTHYVGLVVAGTTAPTLTGNTLQNAVVAALGFKRAGTAGSGLTATQASVALSGVTAVATIPYVRVA